jgi:hypothetical protein
MRTEHLKPEPGGFENIENGRVLTFSLGKGGIISVTTQKRRKKAPTFTQPPLPGELGEGKQPLTDNDPAL